MSWNKYVFPEPIRFIYEQTSYLHDFIILIGIIIILILLLRILISNFFIIPLGVWPTEIDKLEIVWTIIPLILLVLISIPSIRILAFLEEPYEQFVSLKIIANQWFWTYYYLNSTTDFDSVYYENSDERFRQIEVDNRVILPYHIPVSILISRIDVIHSWALPILGVKIDAIPGRLNRIFIYGEKPGVFWGQCREICGVNHSFIPITVEFVNINRILFKYYN